MAFYFAWTDAGEAFNPGTHAREDEDIFNLGLSHSEGDFASVVVDVRNPRVGLLNAGRKRWAWVSYRKRNGTLVPLFYGRLVGIPDDMQNDLVRLTFVARPSGYDEAKATFANTLRVAPYYDDVWVSVESRQDPDLVLEGRPALFHIDRVTHAISVSDIITGEDSQLDFTTGQVMYDSVKMGYDGSPARRAVMTASVNWTQAGSGDIDMTKDLIKAFETEGFPGLFDVRGREIAAAGTIAVVPGEDLIASWPEFGDSIGGGWTVGESSAVLVGDRPLPPILAGNQIAYAHIRAWDTFRDEGYSTGLRQVFERAPGFVVEVQDTTSQEVKNMYGDYQMYAHGKVNILWVSVWRIAPKLKLHWDVQRERTETLQFEMLADVQDVLSEPGEEATIYLDAGSADVDEFVANPKRKAFLSTDRGVQALNNLVARARAALLARARCVEISFAVPFEDGLTLSCRRSASVADPRLPGGIAAGKIKGYSLTVDGNSGEMLATVNIGCTVGRDGAITPTAGTPSYVAAGYVNAGYQVMTGEIAVPIAGAVGVSLAYEATDDGVDLDRIDKSYVTSLAVDGTLEMQQEAAQDGVAETSATAFDRINAYKTSIKFVLKPVSGGPFLTSVQPVLTALKVPRTINLEAA